ncbi:MAG: hypothetical protein ACREC8_11225 [Limisphaerales bacterium]
MKSLLKIIVVAAGVAIVSATVVVIVQPSRQSHKKVAPLKNAPPEGAESELPTAISNYSKTFKLNTNPPIWTTPANGRNATN